MNDRSCLIASKARELKGAPLSCIILMCLARRPVGAEYLERNSGYSRKPVYSALLYLEENGYITRNGRYSWQISVNTSQLPVIHATLEFISSYFLQADHQGYLLRQLNEPENLHLVLNQTNLQNYDTEITHLPGGIIPDRCPSSSRLINTRSIRSLGRNPLLHLEGVKNNPERINENIEQCKLAGIGEPMRSVLSKEEHVTPDLIRYHVETSENIRIAIYRIKKGWRISQKWLTARANE